MFEREHFSHPLCEKEVSLSVEDSDASFIFLFFYVDLAENSDKNEKGSDKSLKRSDKLLICSDKSLEHSDKVLILVEMSDEPLDVQQYRELSIAS
ncbi:hypothetical protein [Lysinibacillus sp. fls2-241-R2A-57]|uniref:hypothetical protein n=1 Tax=Lysinibacillus sp. fls2-241-R2A-57 TaxID=3040292 RepID=UPI002557B3CD|nr:hypothetical protein [Lysinibacillus sp. fls2-241-R2A-57]